MDNVNRAGGLRLWLALLVAACMVGCREKDTTSDVVPIEGRVERVDTVNRTITATYRNPKDDEEVVGTGEITPATEFLVNGVISTLEDLRVGDRIRGEVRVEGHGAQKRMVILKVQVERPRKLGGPGR